MIRWRDKLAREEGGAGGGGGGGAGGSSDELQALAKQVFT